MNKIDNSTIFEKSILNPNLLYEYFSYEYGLDTVEANFPIFTENEKYL